MSREILPTTGACVVFTIDPLASLGPKILEDPEAIEACKELVNKRYVAFIGGRPFLYQPFEPYNECMVEFILQGEPMAVPDQFLEASMSVPILPVTIENHPSSRVPLKPSNPLPWNDCFLSPIWGATVRHPTAFTEDPIDCLLDLKELSRHDRFLGSDLTKIQNRRWEAGEEAPDNDAASTTVSSLNQDPTADDFSAAMWLDDAFVPSDSWQPMITVNFSHDLSTVKELNHPADYFKEVEAINRVYEEARCRIAEAKSRAIKAAADMDAELYDEKTIRLLVARPVKGRIGRVMSRLRKTSKRIARHLICWAHPMRIR
ncbi:hypothetical protein C8R43DRAFT_1127083 [Mycena crocata]|nr:hypothetical protein C8R43DRAFT_1127083 [Mycena crocata]